MNREESVQFLIEHLCKVYHMGACTDLAALFKQAIDWVDKHPKNPWISVEEDLPEDDPVVSNKEFRISKRVFARHELWDTDIYVAEYDHSIKAFVNTSTGEPVRVTHWMKIPDLKGGK